MNARRQQSAIPSQDSSSPPAVQAPPPAIGMGQGHPEYHFVVGLMEVKGQLGQITASLEALTKSVDSMKADVKSLNSLKDKMTGAVVVLSIVGTLVVGILGFVAKVTYDFAMKPAPVVAAVTAAPPAINPPQQVATPATRGLATSP